MQHPNLTPFQKGEDRARDAGRKGGIASGEAKRERFRQLLLAELDKEAVRLVPPPEILPGCPSPFAEAEYVPAGHTVRAKLAKALIAKAEAGDLKALALVLKLTEGGGDDDTGEA